MKKLVSIIIPAFNAEKWIKASIESAIAQTWKWKEIIVVDDGSTDSTLKIAQTYTSSIIVVVTKENGGASSARNLGLSLSQGDYVQWLDADDLLDPAKIARQMEDAEDGHHSTVLLSAAWGKFLSSPMRASFSPDRLWEDLDPLEWLLRKIEQNLWMPPIVFLTSRRLANAAGLWNEKLSLDDDGEYFSRVISRASKVRFFPEARSFKRSTIGLSHSATLSNSKLDSQWSSISSLIKTVRLIKDDSRTKRACLILLNRWSIYFYPERPDIISQMHDLALEMGGILDEPKLPDKYRWIQRCFGWKSAKKVQHTLPVVSQAMKKISERLGLIRNTAL